MSAKRKHKANFIPFIITICVLVLLIGGMIFLIASCSSKAFNNGSGSGTTTAQNATVTENITAATDSDTTKTTSTTKNSASSTEKTANFSAKTTTKSNSSGSSSDTVKTAYNNYIGTFSTVPDSNSISKSQNDITIGQQILVNNSHKYNDSQSKDFVGMTSLSGRSFALAYNDLDADRFTLKQFNSMTRGFYNKYDYKLEVCSGYRSVASQTNKFNNSVASSGLTETLKWYARPGCSEHHTGYAIDFNTNAFGSSAFTGSGKQAWVSQNCHKYGFILRYTSDKKSITGVNAEAWHFRQVGIAHADYIMKNGICYEEYIDLVKNYSISNPLTVNASAGGTYYIWYVKSQGSSTKIDLTGYKKYTCSGNNDGGFIITAMK